MKKLFGLGLLLLLCIADPVLAAKARFCSVSGANDTVCTIGSPCNLTKAMSVAAPGDTVYFSNGLYSAFPTTTNAGTDTSTGAITLISKSFAQKIDQSDTLVSFTYATGRFNKPFVKYSHLMFRASGKTLAWRDAGQADTLGIFGCKWTKIQFWGHTEFAKLNWCTFDSCNFDTTRFIDGKATHFWFLATPQDLDGGSAGGIAHCYNNTIRYCNFNLSTMNAEPDQWAKWLFMIDYGNFASLNLDGVISKDSCDINAVRNLIFHHNKVNVTFTPYAAIGDPRAFYFAASMLGNFSYNTWRGLDYTTSAYGTGNRDQFFRIRDNFNHNTFDHDSILIQGRLVSMMFSSDTQPVNFASDNSFKYCYIDWNGQNSHTWPVAIEMQKGFWNTTFSHCIINSSKGGIGSLSVKGTNSIDHCTFNINSGFKAILLDMDTGYAQWDNLSTLSIQNNIFTVRDTTSSSTNSAVQYEFVPTNNNFICDHNLYNYKKSKDRQVTWKICTGIANGCAPNSGWRTDGIGTGYPWGNTIGKDLNSSYGSPAFKDSSYATFNPRTTYIGNNRFGNDGYVGAIPYSLLYTLKNRTVPFSGISFRTVAVDSGGYIAAVSYPPDGIGVDVDKFAAPDSILFGFNSATSPPSPIISGYTVIPIDSLSGLYVMPAYTDTVSKTIDCVIFGINGSSQSLCSVPYHKYSYLATVWDRLNILNWPEDSFDWRYTPPIYNLNVGGNPFNWSNIGWDSPYNLQPHVMVVFDEALQHPTRFDFTANDYRIDVYGMGPW